MIAPLAPEAVRRLAAKFCAPKPQATRAPKVREPKAPKAPRRTHRADLVDFVRRNGPTTSLQAAAYFDRALSSVSADLAGLWKAGVLVRLKPCRRTPPVKPAVYAAKEDKR